MGLHGALLVSLLLVPGLATAKATPPPAPKRPVVDAYWGTKVQDDYRWLEDWNDPQVKAWSEAQNTRARSVLAKLPNRQAIHARAEALLKTGSASYQALVRRKGVLFALKSQPPKLQSFLVTLASAEDTTSERVILDPNALDPTGSTAIDFFRPSQDGRLVAVSLSKGGSESGDLHIFDVKTGQECGEVLPHVNNGTAGGSVAWDGEGSGFYYTRYPKPGERAPGDMEFYQQIFFHKLGTPQDQDAYCIGKDFPRIAETELRTSEDGNYILAKVENGDGGEFAFYLLNPSGQWVGISSFQDKVVEVQFGPGEALYLLSRKDAAKGKILKLALASPELSKAAVIVQEGEDSIEWFQTTRTKLYLHVMAGGPSRVDLVDGAGAMHGHVPLPPVAGVWQIVPLDGDSALIQVATYLQPTAWYRYDDAEGKLARTALFQTSPADFSDCEVVRERVASKDGTKVPLTILKRKGIRLDGTHPALLSGYGGFGMAEGPYFSAARRIWLDQGGVLAIANLRGGSEFGEAWHEGGRLTRKQNVFDDFLACARYLVKAKYTSSRKLAIQGGSNGGLLMGAALTQAPKLFRAVVSHVGIYDMLRNELTPNGTFNVTEYGSVKDREQFQALFAYSPYHHVKDGTAYPAVLFLTGANDPRVDPMNSRKMTARLQAATSSGRPVLLRTSSSTGHGIGTPLSERIEEETDVHAYLFHELGVKYR